MRVAGLVALAFAAAPYTASAEWPKPRKLEEILEEKGVLTEKELQETKQGERAQAKTATALPSLPEWVNKFTPYGDVRVRNEAFFRKGDPDRNRDRFRLRFGAKVAINDYTELNFRLASGASGDPISNNQTFTDTFTPKGINVNIASLKLSPGAAVGLSPTFLTLLGGKFETPTYRPTVLLFDADLTPEGFYEALRPIDAKEGFLRKIEVGAGQWIFQENSKTGESAVYAIQGVTTLAPLDSVVANIGVADYDFHKPSTIATARNGNSSLNITNGVRISDGSIIAGRAVDPTKLGPNKDGKDADGKTLKITNFVSEFNILNVGGDVTLDTGVKAWPVRLFADYVENTDASSGHDTGYELGVGVGANKDPGDINVVYYYEHLETDAVISAFADSEFGDAGTNNEGHAVSVGYVLWKNLQLISTAYFVEPIDNVSGRSSERLIRWQVDAIARF
jgi:hypothetical protein